MKPTVHEHLKKSIDAVSKASALTLQSQQHKLPFIIGISISLFIFSTNSVAQYSASVTYEFVVEIVNTHGYVVRAEEMDREIVFEDIGTGTLIEFAIVSNGGKVYTHWHVKGEKERGLFIVERSTNNKDYEQIGFKRGIGVVIENKILYCWVDEEPPAGDCSYRLLKVYEDGRYYYSEVVGSNQRQRVKPNTKDETPLIAAKR
ncbi:MAG: hypothetical protein COB85_03665 [Bacteroidetes bacterium]|nr:MAG: hypothetical protein COB85_03665 [Bacteroidota bacterium]